MISNHNAFDYLGREFHITFFAPLGISTDAEPSAMTVVNLIKRIKKEKIHVMLAATFPPYMNLNYPHQRAMILWDAFELDKERLISLGVSALLSPIPNELAVGIIHGLLRASLQENPELSLKEFERKLSLINPSLKAHLLISQYHKGTHTFSFHTNGEYKVNHRTGQDETTLKPSQTSLLNLGDIITLEETASGASLSLSCLK